MAARFQSYDSDESGRCVEWQQEQQEQQRRPPLR